MLERYEIKQQISYKAGRSTYLAEDSETNKQVIIKILEFNALFEWDDLKLFEREAKTLKNLSHPNIPQFLDYFEINEENCQGFPKEYPHLRASCYAQRHGAFAPSRRRSEAKASMPHAALVQTYINAPSLAEIIEQGIHFSESEIIELAKKLLDILNYIHGLNPPVIHRDIKPSNILLTNRSGNSIGDVYLVDFGSVQTVAKKEAGTITIVGSYGYIPLEQFMGQTTFASDIYSLGMTLIYLVTGIHPAELTQATGKVQFDTSTISRDFAHWLTKATEPYIDKRYKSAASALAALSSSANCTANNLKPEYINTPEYTKLKLNRDRQKLEIIFLESIKASSWASWIIVPIVAILFMSGIGGLILAILWHFTKTFKKLNFIPQSYKFRMISITKDRYIYSKSVSYTATKSEKAWESLSIKHLRWLPATLTHSYGIESVVFSPPHTGDKYSDLNDKLIKGKNNTADAKLSILTRCNEFSITESSSKDGRIKESELLSLLEEIIDFLDLELKTVSQLSSI